MEEGHRDETFSRFSIEAGLISKEHGARGVSWIDLTLVARLSIESKIEIHRDPAQIGRESFQK